MGSFGVLICSIAHVVGQTKARYLVLDIMDVPPIWLPCENEVQTDIRRVYVYQSGEVVASNLLIPNIKQSPWAVSKGLPIVPTSDTILLTQTQTPILLPLVVSYDRNTWAQEYSTLDRCPPTSSLPPQ